MARVVIRRHAITLVRMVLGPFRIGGDAEIAEDQHPFLVSELHHLRQEVMLETRLLRHEAVLVPGIPIPGDGEGLNDIGANRLVPGHVLYRVRRGPGAGLCKKSFIPVEIQTVRFDLLDLRRLAVRTWQLGGNFSRRGLQNQSRQR